MDAALTTGGMTRRELLAAGAATSVALGARRLDTNRARPNFLFIHTDQQSFRTISSLGCGDVDTPNLDQLVRGGTAFTESYCTDPVCMPARAGWYTGRPSLENGVRKNGLPLVPHLPDAGAWLRKAGYRSVYVGKWHVPGRELADSFEVLTGKTIYGENSDGVVSNAAAGFLQNFAGEQPFFLNVGFLQPHDINYWLEKFEHQGNPLYPEIESELPELPPNFDPKSIEPESLESRRKKKDVRRTEAWSELHWRTYLWMYYRHVEMVDAEIGRVLDALSSTGLDRTTMVIFSSDHGEGVAGQGLVGKGFLYEEAVKVPFIVSWPEALPAGVVDTQHLVSGLDVFPTLCDFAGADPPDDLRGRSLRPLLETREGELDGWREHLISESDIDGRMVRSEAHKLIAYAGDERCLLFDLSSDPWETHDLSREQPEQVARHRALLSDWESKLNPAPEPEDGWRGGRGR